MDKRKAAWQKQHSERVKAQEAAERAQAAAGKAREREKAKAEQSLIQCASQGLAKDPKPKFTWTAACTAFPLGSHPPKGASEDTTLKPDP